MRTKISALLLGTALALQLLPLTSHAEGSYVKLGVGQSRYWDDGSSTATGYLLAYGTQVDSSLDMEFGYIDFGQAKINTTFEDLSGDLRFKTQSLYAAGIGNIPMSPTLTLQGKLGLSINRSSAMKVSTNLQDFPGGEDQHTNIRMLIGAGLKMQISKEISGLVEYTYFGNAAHGAKLGLFNAALGYHF